MPGDVHRTLVEYDGLEPDTLCFERRVDLRVQRHDIRLGSNSVGHIASANYKIRPDLVAAVTGSFGRVPDPTKTPSLVAPEFRTACNTAPYTGSRDPFRSRLQFDLVYTFQETTQ